MLQPPTQSAARARDAAAFTLVEALVGTALLGMMAVGLYAGISWTFGTMQMARENQRATQVLLDKTEAVRGLRWDQATSPGFVPAAFTASFDPADSTNPGFTYHGTLAITNAPVTQGYSGSLRLVITTLSWTNGGLARQREMRTLISEHEQL